MKKEQNKSFLIMRTMREWMAHAGITDYGSDVPTAHIGSMFYVLGELGLFCDNEDEMVKNAICDLFQNFLERIGGSITVKNKTTPGPGIWSIEIRMPSGEYPRWVDSSLWWSMFNIPDFIAGWMHAYLADLPGAEAAAVRAELDWSAFCTLCNEQDQRIHDRESEIKIVCFGTYFAAFSLREFRYLRWFKLSPEGVQDAKTFLKSEIMTM